VKKKMSQARETVLSLVEDFPEVLALLFDVGMLAKSAHADEVGGVAVAGMMLGALARVCRSITKCGGKLGDLCFRTDIARSARIWGVGYVWVAAYAVAVAPLWLFRHQLEAFVGLPGLAAYMLLAAPASVLTRLFIVGFFACAGGRIRQVGRARLSWVFLGVNATANYALIPRYGATGAAAAWMLADLPFILVIWWAYNPPKHDEDAPAPPPLLAWPRREDIHEVLSDSWKKAVFEAMAVTGTAAAVLLNRWLDADLSRQWSVLHTMLGVSISLGTASWGVGARWATNALGTEEGEDGKKPPPTPEQHPEAAACWKWGDRFGWHLIAAAMIPALLLAAWVGESLWLALFLPPVAVAEALHKRAVLLREITADEDGFIVAGLGKLTYSCLICAGYWVLTTVAEPVIWPAVVIFIISQLVGAFIVTRIRRR